QPPLYTLLLSQAFKACGPNIGTARFVAAGFGLVLFAVFHELVRRRSGAWTALIATFLLAASPGILQLCVSVMLEAPPIGIGLISALLLLRWRDCSGASGAGVSPVSAAGSPSVQSFKPGTLTWLLLSGAVMGLAMGIKLTVVLIVPAILTEIAFASKTASG